MNFNQYGENDDLLNALLRRNNNSFSQSNGNNNATPQAFGGNSNTFSSTDTSSSGGFGADGKDSGGIKGLFKQINPISAGLNVAQAGVNIAQAVSQPNFDYGQQNYSVQDAANYQGNKAANIAKAAGGAIPVFGGVLGGLFGMIAQKIAQHKAEAHAHMILGNRQEHMNNLQDYQMQKIKDNNFLRSSDLFKNMDDNNFQSNQI